MHLIERRRFHALAGLALWSAALLPAKAQPRGLMLATRWQPGRSPAGYWVSEKLDGLRGYWDGQQLWTRGGQPVQAPNWFTEGWPAEALDGELWAGRSRFEEVLSTVRRQGPDEAAWRRVRFMVFDLPDHGGTFTERLATLAGLIERTGSSWLRAIEQQRSANTEDLNSRLQGVIAQGGEGLMLHHGQAHYQPGRSAELLKLKVQDDAEARVVGHEAGKGQHQGRLGALVLELPASEGFGVRRFSLGTGLSNEIRRNPPPLGTVVTFRYHGLTRTGLPRFASFWRLRAD